MAVATTRALHNEPVYLPGGPHACLMLHGFGGGAYELLWLAEDLNRQGLTVQTINYPGHDRKTDPMPACTWQDWYAHIEATYLQLREQHERVSVIGLSTGCPLALWLAHHHPVDRLVLISPFLDLKRRWYHLVRLETCAPLVALFQKVIQRKGADIREPELARLAWVQTYLTTFNVSALRSALSLIRQVKAIAPELRNPVLILQSETDEVVDPSGAKFLMRHLASPRKEIRWLRRSNHVLTLDYDRDTVTEAVTSFLSD